MRGLLRPLTHVLVMSSAVCGYESLLQAGALQRWAPGVAWPNIAGEWCPCVWHNRSAVGRCGWGGEVSAGRRASRVRPTLASAIKRCAQRAQGAARGSRAKRA